MISLPAQIANYVFYNTRFASACYTTKMAWKA